MELERESIDSPMESLEFYMTCGHCAEEGIETVLEGVGEYCRESNTLFAFPCPVCKHEAEIEGWLEECDDCGELHYEVDGCEEEGE